MIENVTVPARLCTCNECSYIWVSIAVQVPTHCQNRKCRSREWNGKKVKQVKARPVVVLPKTVKIRGGEEDEQF